MDSQQLIKMANQNGQFFESMPNREAAEKDIATHLKRFWDPRMRRVIVASLDTDDAASMSAIVREALTTHRQLLA
jgi:formate dehydrogenase subunit delta